MERLDKLKSDGALVQHLAILVGGEGRGGREIMARVLLHIVTLISPLVMANQALDLSSRNARVINGVIILNCLRVE